MKTKSHGANAIDVFLCHNSCDKKEVRRIARALKRKGVTVWFDEWNLCPGRPWTKELENTIAQIKSVAVFVGKHGVGPWQRNEYDGFLKQFVDRGCPVIPCVLQSAPHNPRLPLFLREFTWVDFRKRTRPAAIDRLVWGISGVIPSSHLIQARGDLPEGAKETQGIACENLESIGSESDFLRLAEDLKDCFNQAQSDCPQASLAAVDRIRTAYRNSRSSFLNFLKSEISKKASTKIISQLLDHLRLEQSKINVEIKAYKDFHTPVSANDALNWISEPLTRWSALADPEISRIYIARICPSQRGFKAAWLNCGGIAHILLINGNQSGPDFVDSVVHEIDHILDYVRQNAEKSCSSIKAMTPNASTLVPFAQAQKQVDPDDKDLVARWIADELRLSNGSGVFLDAGSQCMVLWKAIREQVRKNLYSHLAVRTNSFLVLDQWVQDQALHPQGNTVETVGDVFDVGHLAFYGPAAKSRLMEGNFRPTVYIGTSGIEFGDGSILFGYHQGSLEGDFKQLLFQCPSRSRVILATPQKIGNAGGRVFDLLRLEGLNISAPIILVTTNPPKDSTAERTFREAQNALRSENMQEAIKRKGLKFTWVTVDRESRDIPKALETFTVPSPSSS